MAGALRAGGAPAGPSGEPGGVGPPVAARVRSGTEVERVRSLQITPSLACPWPTLSPLRACRCWRSSSACSTCRPPGRRRGARAAGACCSAGLRGRHGGAAPRRDVAARLGARHRERPDRGAGAVGGVRASGPHPHLDSAAHPAARRAHRQPARRDGGAGRGAVQGHHLAPRAGPRAVPYVAWALRGLQVRRLRAARPRSCCAPMRPWVASGGGNAVGAPHRLGYGASLVAFVFCWVRAYPVLAEAWRWGQRVER